LTNKIKRAISPLSAKNGAKQKRIPKKEEGDLKREKKMYLKKIEVEKFKSFSKHFSIPFFPGFTAITGPNGSGKSNLCDAIIFVLGPKSPKMIRAGRLTDLIYNGGKAKEGADHCKVSLVFDNQDHSVPIESEEVTLTRVIKKVKKEADPDGYYSYFYINGRSASLSDFSNLLASSRINGYNIIQQGAITRLVDMTSGERRKIIDDLAGITKFDQEIEKAELEKARVEENLKRIKIILREVEKQVYQLKHERDQAIKYKNIEERLDKAKVKLALKKKGEFEADFKQLAQELESYQTEFATCEDKISKIKKEKEKARSLLHELERKITENTEAKLLSKQIEQNRERLIRIEERLNWLKRERETDSQDKSQLEKEALRLIKILEEKRKEEKKLREELGEKQSKVNHEKEKISQLRLKIASLATNEKSVNQELFQLKQKWEEKQKRIYGLKLEKDRIEQLLGDLRGENERIGKELEGYQTELKEREWKIRETKHLIDQKIKIKGDLLAKLEERKKYQATIKEKLREVEESLPELRRECAKFKEAMATQQGGYSRAINALLKKRSEIEGILGPVIELISFDEKYWKAVQASGGSRLFSMVVANDSVAAKCINYLKTHELGRAVFLPLNKLRKGTPRASALLKMQAQGVQGFVKDLIRLKSELEGVLWWVFGDTLLVKNLEFARRLMGGTRLVTLDGELIDASGAMTGGSLVKASVIRRVQPREDPLKKLADAEAKKVNLEKELIRAQGEIGDIKEKIAELAETSEERYGELELERQKFKGNIKQLHEKKEQRIKNLKAGEEKLESLSANIKEIEEEIVELDKAREGKSKALAEGSPELSEKLKEKESQTAELEIEISEIEAKVQSIQSQVDLFGSREEEVRERLNKLTEGLANTEKEIGGLTQQYSKEKVTYEKLLLSNEEVSKKLEGIYSKREKLQAQELELERELERAQLQKECKLDSIRNVQARLDTLRQNLEQISEEIKSYEVEIPEDFDSQTLELIKLEIRDLEEKQRNFGPVNMLAIKEWEEKKDKERMHEEEIKRLNQQKKELIQLVEEIKRRKKDKFFEVFNSLNEQFKQTYADLNRGEAELLLENPSEPFEGGLTIKARPEGKKALRLPALSGGEKSLASLAFVFAIQKFLPSPFYVLDEVDMFLDNLNAEGVASMIKENSSHAQWITISLHESMLRAADHIYGVTMQEKDSSKIIGGVNVGR
jgi:chromosome segregation protein